MYPDSDHRVITASDRCATAAGAYPAHMFKIAS